MEFLGALLQGGAQLLDAAVKDLNNAGNYVNQNVTKAINTVELFSFKEAVDFLKEKISTVTGADKCLIAVNNRYDVPVSVAEKSPNVNYIVRMIILDGEENPIYADNENNSYVGRVVYTNGIDEDLQQFMGDEKKKILSEKDFPKKIYTYKKIKEYYFDNKRNVPNACQLLIAVCREDEIPNFSARTGKNKLVIRLIFLDENENPIYKNSENTAYYGKTILADDIDEDLQSYMDGSKKKIMNM